MIAMYISYLSKMAKKCFMTHVIVTNVKEKFNRWTTDNIDVNIVILIMMIQSQD